MRTSIILLIGIIIGIFVALYYEYRDKQNPDIVYTYWNDTTEGAIKRLTLEYFTHHNLKDSVKKAYCDCVLQQLKKRFPEKFPISHKTLVYEEWRVATWYCTTLMDLEAVDSLDERFYRVLE